MNILSSISGQFSKPLVLGSFFPVTIFVLLGLVFIVPLFPSEWTFLSPLEVLDPQWRILALLLLTLVLSGVLFNLNTPIIRLYEGYPWQHSSFGKWRKRRYQADYERLLARYSALRGLNRHLSKPPRPPEYTKAVISEGTRLGPQIRSDYPDDVSFVLPTKLGNVIRSYETYARTQHGMEAIALWPRLVAVIDKGYAATIDDEKTTLDFMLNCSLLSTIMTTGILVLGLMFPGSLSGGGWIPWIAEIVVFSLAIVLFYQAAIGRARAWGNTVKSAFDLYRCALLKQLGYEGTPATHGAERQLWTAISYWLVYGSKEAEAPPFKATSQPPGPPSIALSNPPGAALQITRGVGQVAKGVMPVTVRVYNPITSPATVQVTVEERLPDGFEYIWDSATVAGSDPAQPVAVQGIGPYRFLVGALAPGGTITFTYGVVTRPKPS